MPNNLLPTKGNLIAAKHSRGLAQTGFELMDRKRNILIRELMGMMDTAKELQGQIYTVFTEAYAALQAANIRLGICDRIAEAVEVDDSLTLRYRSVMGVELPRIPGQSPPPRPEYGLGETCSELDECYLKFHKVKELTRRLAEVETSIYRLATAIKKTQKRANALENIVIPGLDETIRFITDALEEKEREEFARLKVIKRVTTKGKGDRRLTSLFLWTVCWTGCPPAPLGRGRRWRRGSSCIRPPSTRRCRSCRPPPGTAPTGFPRHGWISPRTGCSPR